MTLVLVVVAAVLQCLFGIAGYALLSQSGNWVAGIHGFGLAQLLIRFGAGILLVLAGFRDRRTLLFGAVMLLTATAFAHQGFVYVVHTSGMFSLQFFSALQLEALFPFYFWRFARVFPEAFLRPAHDRLIDLAERASLAAGLFLITCNIVLLFYPQLTLLNAFDRSDSGSLFHSLLYGLTLPILLVLWLRMRTAREEEQRRVKVFIVGLLVTIVPAVTYIALWGISSDLRQFVERDQNAIFVEPFFHTLLIATPIITTYAVLVERLLPINILLRQVFRYWLGNGFIVLGIALPLLLLGYYLYNSRTLSIASVFDGYNGLFIAIALGLSLLMFEQRHRARQYLDALFYRSGYDANGLLAELAQSAQSCTSLADIAQVTQNILDQALHPQNSHLLFISNNQTLRDPHQELADLPLQSTLASTLLTLQQPLPARGIPTAEGGADERWLSQANANVLLPIKVKTANTGVLVIGRKRSELPYTHADFNFIHLVLNTVIGPCGHLLEAWNAQERDKRAAQCTDCGTVMAEATHCIACGSTQFTEALLPKILHQHYDVMKVLGSGLGVVYLAQDTQLQRPVILKTVASASVDELQFLRDEARVMATVSHRHIASIYGLESFQGMPILVCEYLPGGTLEDVMRDGYLARDEVLAIIEEVAQALIYLHGRGISHGDIKPSNIGFDEDDVAKLLDFGLANRVAGTVTTTGSGSGTYAYMSPEKIQGRDYDQRADLWALAATLFETLYGVNPFAADDLPGIIDKVTNAQGSLRAAVASPSPFLLTALNSDIAKRPQTAEQFTAMMKAGI
ncbi:MAG: serine/threonine-protein kinase [Halioglobus sp.]